MEKKKLLIVAVSVGVVLLIMIGVPLMIINRQSTAAPTTAWHAVQPELSSVDRFRPQQIPEQLAQQPESLGQTADEPAAAGNLNLPPRVTIPAPLSVPTPPPSDGDEAATITIPTPRTAAVPETPPAEKPAPARPATTAPAERPAPPPAVAAQPVKPAAPTAKPAAPTAAKPAATAAATRSNFWVQTGAFSSNARAESVKESLETKGIVSIIENRSVDGRTLYRVRVGPYLSETEANYWLALVRSIDGFSDSQVRVSQVPVNN